MTGVLGSILVFYCSELKIRVFLLGQRGNFILMLQDSCTSFYYSIL